MISQSDSTMTQSCDGSNVGYSDACEVSSEGGFSSTSENCRASYSLLASLCQSGSNLNSVISTAAAAFGNIWTEDTAIAARVGAAFASIWTEDSACVVCGLELGKRKLRPRHHCRVCWGSVCAKCSPSRVHLVGEKMPQRACNPCVLNVEVGLDLRERLEKLSDQLNIIGSSHSCPVTRKADTLEKAVRNCESALPRLEQKHMLTQHQLQEMRTMCATAQSCAREREIQLQGLLVSRSERLESVPSGERSQGATRGSQGTVRPQAPPDSDSDGMDGLLF